MRTLLGDPGYPLLLDNEANLAARAEVETADRAGVDHLVLLTGVVGVGAGVVTAGQLLRGVRGFAGEVGHLQLDPGGRRCGCGRRGCWETVAGLNALLAAAADPDDPVRDPLDRRRTAAGRLLTGPGRGRRRPHPRRAGPRPRGWLGIGAGILVNLFDPELLVLGGYFARLGPWLAEPLAASLPDRVFAPASGGCRVEPSSLGFTAAARGGALEAMSRIFDDPTAVASPRAAAVPAGAPA